MFDKSTTYDNDVQFIFFFGLLCIYMLTHAEYWPLVLGCMHFVLVKSLSIPHQSSYNYKHDIYREETSILPTSKSRYDACGNRKITLSKYKFEIKKTRCQIPHFLKNYIYLISPNQIAKHCTPH